MSAPFASTELIPLAIVIASFMGSAHCVGMCGGIVVAVSRSKRKWAEYQFGRLVGYLTLGAAAGAVGQQALSSDAANGLSWGSALLVSAALLIAGMYAWKGKALHVSLVPQSLLNKLFKLSRGNAAAIGGLTAFLPCGWLHSFVVGAIATQSPVRGALFLFAFWLGTLPALGAAPWLLDKVLKPVSAKFPRVAAVLLIAAGLGSIGSKIAPTLLQAEAHGSHAEAKQHSCH